MSQPLRFYVQGDGGLWRISHKEILAWTPGDYFEGRQLAVRTTVDEWGDELWRASELPRGLEAYPDRPSRLASYSNEVKITDYDNIDVFAHWQGIILAVRRPCWKR